MTRVSSKPAVRKPAKRASTRASSAGYAEVITDFVKDRSPSPEAKADHSETAALFHRFLNARTPRSNALASEAGSETADLITSLTRHLTPDEQTYLLAAAVEILINPVAAFDSPSTSLKSIGEQLGNLSNEDAAKMLHRLAGFLAAEN